MLQVDATDIEMFLDNSKHIIKRSTMHAAQYEAITQSRYLTSKHIHIIHM